MDSSAFVLLPLSSLAAISPGLLTLISLLLVVLAGLILKGIYDTTVVDDEDPSEGEPWRPCPHCGAQVPDDQPTCGHCGEPLPNDD